MRLLKNCKILQEDFSEKEATVLLKDDKAKLCSEIPSYTQVLDLKGALVINGVCDIHVHGCSGYSFITENPEELTKLSESLRKHGTAYFLATYVVLPPERIKRCLKILRETRIEGLIGAYIEGPFINPEKSGGMKEKYIYAWDKKNFKNLIEQFADIIKLVVVAPELEEAEYVIDVLRKNEIAIAFGHTKADFEVVMKYVESETVSLFTHLYNAMGSFHHRKPGVVAAALLSNVPCEIIPQKDHLHPAAIKLAFKVKGKEKIIPISDGTLLSGKGPEEAKFSGVVVRKRNGACISKEGKLFGSAITLIEGLKYLVELGIYKNLKEAVIYNLKNTSKLLNKKLTFTPELPLIAVYEQDFEVLF